MKTNRPSLTRNSGNCIVIKATVLLTHAWNLSTVIYLYQTKIMRLLNDHFYTHETIQISSIFCPTLPTHQSITTFFGVCHATTQTTVVRRGHSKPSFIYRLLDELRYGFVYIEFSFLSLAIQRQHISFTKVLNTKRKWIFNVNENSKLNPIVVLINGDHGWLI